MEPNGPGRVHLVPFVHSQSYILIRVHLVPNYHLSRDSLELLQVPLGVPGPHFENQCSNGPPGVQVLYVFPPCVLFLLLPEN